MSSDTDTDAFLLKAPHAYLYGAVAEAYMKIREVQKASLYIQQFRSAVLSLNEDADNEEFGGGSLEAFADNVT